MLHVVSGDKEYTIRFAHVPDVETSCQILVGSPGSKDDDKTELVTSHAKRYVKDVFNKKIGRRVALEKALKDTGFDRTLRTQIWAAYADRANHKW